MLDAFYGLFGFGAGRVMADLYPVPYALFTKVNGFKVGVKAEVAQVFDLLLRVLLRLEG